MALRVRSAVGVPAQNGYPWKFYGLTEAGREFLAEHNLLAAEATLQQIDDTISDKSVYLHNQRNSHDGAPVRRALNG